MLNGFAAGAGFAVALLVANVSEIRGIWLRSEQPVLWLLVFTLSSGVNFGQVTILAAVLLRSDFGGRGGNVNDRLAQWKAGGSAELKRDEPLPR